MKLLTQTLSLILVILPFSASAVIVGGASGGGNTLNNTTAAQYLSEYGTSIPIYENVIRYSDASGIYLGYNAATKDVWVLTARHVSSSGSLILDQGRTVTIDGLVYNRQPEGPGGFGLLPGDGDLRLVRYNRPDLAVPTLPAINISTSIPLAGTTLLTVGYGQNRTQNATLDASTSDAVSVVVGTGYNWSNTKIKRWGVNQIEAEFLDSLETVPVPGTTGTFSLGPYSTTGYMTDFDQPGSGQWLSSNESQGSLGDSGGSAFYYSGGQWYLSGIYTSVVGFSGQAGSTSAFGNLSLLTDVATYSAAIHTALSGVTLVPEMTSSALALLTGCVLFSRRSRQRV